MEHEPAYRRSGFTPLQAVPVLAAVLALLLTGCGSDPLVPEDTGEQVLYGPTVRIQGFDPVRSGDVASSMAIARIYEGLLQYAYLDRPYRVRPLLARSMPEVSEDGLTYTFRVREGIRFQDDPCFAETDGKGRELTAQDFVYSIKRVADVKNASPGYWAFQGRIRGLDAFREASKGEQPTDYDREVEGLTAPGRYTLRFELLEPYPQLLWILAMHYAFAVPREAVEYYGDEFLNHPVGTGPFVLDSWKRNYRVEFVRNPAWTGDGRVERYPSEGSPADRRAGLLADAGERLPFLDRIVQFVVEDSTTQWMMFLAGQFSLSGISRDNWDAVVTPEKELGGVLRERGVDMVSSPTLDLFYIGFNMDDPVVGSHPDPRIDARRRKLRQAMACAFDHEEWTRFYNNRIAPAYGPIPEPLAGSRAKPGPYAFNLEKARRLIAEAGYPEGVDPETGRRLELNLEVGAAAAGDTRQSVELFAHFMDRIGIRISPSYNNWPTFMDKLNRGQAQLFRLGWVADYPDAENFFQLFYGPNRSPGPNHANYRNPQFDRLYERIRTMMPSDERTEICRRMAAIVIEDSPWIFMHQPMSYALVHSWVRNYKPHDFPYGMGKYRRIDMSQFSRWRRTYGEERMGLSVETGAGEEGEAGSESESESESE
ncbi:ABC transporter substrate-binding protein [Kiritimatiella glycovorans]|uniref:ABC-type oligopeptide transport system,periplasmic component n=1 Tax=Kiritimatiella glycovorans TaxID=1307763 RepID=A0A0G3EEN8_9BACT|nr:ABC transporter substrate-binding protein [Kiritimatiella glycovorans]AKJ63832.1 ABC-type oligopeptide transport system,periplasmic component [Kiritimatiella glycovorans]